MITKDRPRAAPQNNQKSESASIGRRIIDVVMIFDCVSYFSKFSPSYRNHGNVSSSILPEMEQPL